MSTLALSLPNDLSCNAFNSSDFLSSSPANKNGASKLDESNIPASLQSNAYKMSSSNIVTPSSASSLSRPQQSPQVPASQPLRNVGQIGMAPSFSNLPSHQQFPFLTPSPHLAYPPGTSIHPQAGGPAYFPSPQPSPGPRQNQMPNLPQADFQYQMAMQAAAFQHQQQQYSIAQQQPIYMQQPLFHNQPFPYAPIPQMQQAHSPVMSHGRTDSLSSVSSARTANYSPAPNTGSARMRAESLPHEISIQRPIDASTEYRGGPIRSERKRSDSGSASLPSNSLRRAAAGCVPNPIEATPSGAPYPPRLRTQSSGSSVGSSPKASSVDNSSERSITPTAASPSGLPSTSSSRSASPIPRSVSHMPSASSSSISRPSPLGMNSMDDSRISEDRGIGFIYEKEKKSGFNKIKKAFSMNSLSKGHEKGRPSNASSSSSASTAPPGTPPDPIVGGVRPRIMTSSDAMSSTSTLPQQIKDSRPPPPSSKNRLGMLSKMNSSTDNISISSTVSSASMMLRKIGTLGGRLGKRGSLGSIGSMFNKDKDRDTSDAASEFGVPGSASSNSRLKKKDRKKGALAAASVTRATVEQESPPDLKGMTPAAALAQRHQQMFAEQEAAELAAAKRQKEMAEHAKEMEKKSASDDKRLRGIEKEKEKLKNRKPKKWGLGSFAGNSSLASAPAASSSATSLIGSQQQHVGEFGEELPDDNISLAESYSRAGTPVFPDEETTTIDDRTPRQSMDLASAQHVEHLSRTDNERTGSYFDDDTASFRGQGGSGMNTPRSTYEESGSDYEGSLYRGRQSYHSQPSKNFKPRGILKTSSSFQQETFAPPNKPFARVRASSFDAPGNQNLPVNGQNHIRSQSAQQLSHFAPDSLRGLPKNGQYTASPTEISRENSPAPIRGPEGPYRNAGMNASAPVLNSAMAPPLAVRSATMQPQSKKLVFAQNLSVHTTWPGHVYDRRGGVATCNQLTPVLAQKIKEELNAYKLNEMDVHQTSRIYTHFFA